MATSPETATFQLPITSILILSGDGADQLRLNTLLPDGHYPFTGKFGAWERLAKGTWYAYVCANFRGVDTHITNMPKDGPVESLRIDWTQKPPAIVPDTREVRDGEVVNPAPYLSYCEHCGICYE